VNATRNLAGLTARRRGRTAKMPSVADAPRPTLGETGQIFVTYAAARSFIEPGGYKEHEIEAARRALTDLLIDARQQPNRGTWRTRKRSTKLDISAVVEPEGRLLVVTFVDAQPYDPPSRTSAGGQGRRSRYPASSSDVRLSRRGRSQRSRGGRRSSPGT
jgi:hypothetical protein